MNVYAVLLAILGAVSVGSCITSMATGFVLMFCVNPLAYTKRERWARLWDIVSSNAPEDCYTPLGKKMLRIRRKSLLVLFASGGGILLVGLAIQITNR